MTDRINLASAPRMVAALRETFADEDAIADAQNARDGYVPVDDDAWQTGQDDYENEYWRGMGEAS